MIKSILFSPDEAERINDEVQKIKSSLFVFCNYNPGPIEPLSPDARFLVGVLNLYKLAIDAGIVRGIARIAKSMSVRLKYSLFDIIRQASLLRSAIAHNFMIHNDGAPYAIEFRFWMLQAIGKKNFENTADYEKAFNKVEQLGDNLAYSLREFLDIIGSRSNREIVIEQLENTILEFYDRSAVGTNLIKRQMKELQYAYLVQNTGLRTNRRQTMRFFDDNYAIAKWAEDFCLYEPMNKLKMIDMFRKTYKKSAEKLSDSLLRQEEEAKRELEQLKGDIAKELGKKEEKVNSYTYLAYYVRLVISKIKDRLKGPRPSSLLPQGILQEIIAADMEKVPIDVLQF